jgi:hypothetical protein
MYFAETDLRPVSACFYICPKHVLPALAPDIFLYTIFYN